MTTGPRPPPGAALPEPGAFDSHTHMDIMGLPVDGVLAAARAAGIHRVVNAGCDLPSSRWGARAPRRTRPSAYAAVAVHPNSTAEVDAARAEVLAELERAGRSRRRWSRSARPGWTTTGTTRAPKAQQWWFRAHIALAQRIGKALMIHDRDAHADVLRILEETGPGRRTR